MKEDAKTINASALVKRIIAIVMSQPTPYIALAKLGVKQSLLSRRGLSSPQIFVQSYIDSCWNQRRYEDILALLEAATKVAPDAIFDEYCSGWQEEWDQEKFDFLLALDESEREASKALYENLQTALKNK